MIAHISGTTIYKDGKSLVHYLCSLPEKMVMRRITITGIDGDLHIFTPTPKMLKDEK